jgi:hypothetical protein
LFENEEERRENMEQALPIEELAKQRLNAMVYAYSLFTKNLMEEGVDKEKVKRASDKAWGTLGDQAGEQLKALLGGAEKAAAIQQAGAIARTVHDIEGNVETKENEVRTEFLKCPWQAASESLGIPQEWRFCPSGHAAFAERMIKTLIPEVSFKLTKSMPMGDPVCEEISSF